MSNVDIHTNSNRNKIHFENKFTPTKEVHLDYLKAKASSNKVVRIWFPLLFVYYLLWYPFLVEGFTGTFQTRGFEATFISGIIVYLVFTIRAYFPNFLWFIWVISGKKPVKNSQDTFRMQFGEEELVDGDMTISYLDIKTVSHYFSKTNCYTRYVLKNHWQRVVVHSGFIVGDSKDFITFIDEKTTHCHKTEQERKNIKNTRILASILLPSLPILYYFALVWIPSIML